MNARDLTGFTPVHYSRRPWRQRDDPLPLVEQVVDPAVARSGQTTVDMANSPVERSGSKPFADTLMLLEGQGARSNHRCVSCCRGSEDRFRARIARLRPEKCLLVKVPIGIWVTRAVPRYCRGT